MNATRASCQSDIGGRPQSLSIFFYSREVSGRGAGRGNSAVVQYVVAFVGKQCFVAQDRKSVREAPRDEQLALVVS